MRVCIACHKSKPLSQFYFSRHYSSRCKRCHCVQTKQWRDAHPEDTRRHSKAGHERAKKRPNYHARMRAHDKRRYNTFLMVEKIRRARVRKAGGYVLPLDVNMRAIKRAFEWAGGRCQYCGHSGRKLHIDHIIPPKLGGDHVPGNWMVACNICNGSKRATPVLAWIKKRFCQDIPMAGF